MIDEIQRRLESARHYIDAGWTQSAQACDRNGDEVSPFDKEAMCWCPIGAIKSAYGPEVEDPETGRLMEQPAMHWFAESIRNEVMKTHGEITYRVQINDRAAISAWNDQAGMTQDRVLEMFDRAIHRASVSQKSHPVMELF